MPDFPSTKIQDLPPGKIMKMSKNTWRIFSWVLDPEWQKPVDILNPV